MKRLATMLVAACALALTLFPDAASAGWRRGYGGGGVYGPGVGVYVGPGWGYYGGYQPYPYYAYGGYYPYAYYPYWRRGRAWRRGWGY